MLAMDFAFSQSLNDQIKAYLNTSTSELEAAPPVDTGGQAFGGSPASVGCAGDASKAQHKVKAAIQDMCVGLQGYVDALQQMEDRAYDVEDVTEQQINQTIDKVEVCQTPTISQGGACTVDGS